jgi:hypothetical protein
VAQACPDRGRAARVQVERLAAQPRPSRQSSRVRHRRAAGRGFPECRNRGRQRWPPEAGTGSWVGGLTRWRQRACQSRRCAPLGSLVYCTGGQFLADTELVAFGIGKHNPSGLGRLPNRDPAGAPCEQAVHLLSLDCWTNVEVQPVFHGLRFWYSDEHQVRCDAVFRAAGRRL